MKTIFSPIYFTLIITLLFYGCKPKIQGDLIIVNTHIQLCDSAYTSADAMVIGSGKILAIGSAKDLLSKYQVDSQMSFNGKFIYPGIIDAHCHFYGLGRFLQMLDLSQTKSFDEVVDACLHYYSKQTHNYLLGRGWDQNKWPNLAYPTNNEALNNAFPDIPVLLKRIDGHAAIANDFALRLAGLHSKSKVAGGELLLSKGKLSGVLIDNAVDLVERVMPKPTTQDNIKALLDAQSTCLQYGITAITDAGLETNIIYLIDSLQKVGLLKMRINAMVSLTPENLAFWLKRGPLKTERLQVNSFKMYGDGALGSRGACLLKPYSDQPKHSGFLLTPAAEMEKYIEQIARSPFQLCTHAIGDSTNRLLLKLYGRYIGQLPNKRWRIEHAQVVNSEDINLFGKYGIVPSVQTTHATSDMYWAINRLGPQRIQDAYSYQSLLKQLAWLPLGTDFPVEAVSPFFTFYAAVSRRDGAGLPQNGFQIEEALSRKQALSGITTWPAKAAFQENEMGSLLPGTFADFVVLDIDLLAADMKQIRTAKALQTFIDGLPVNN